MNIKITADRRTVLQQAEAIKLRLLFLPHPAPFPAPFSPLSFAELLTSTAGK